MEFKYVNIKNPSFATFVMNIELFLKTTEKRQFVNDLKRQVTIGTIKNELPLLTKL